MDVVPQLCKLGAFIIVTVKNIKKYINRQEPLI